MSGFVYSLAMHPALGQGRSSWNDDFWSLGDLEVIAENLVAATRQPRHWKRWTIDRGDATRRWLAE
ncbi:MAG TPA: hypothetical protein VN823_24685 [Stellaceae bacterium]|nr:hypothetical protein [Stellaceae bacterium]